MILIQGKPPILKLIILHNFTLLSFLNNSKCKKIVVGKFFLSDLIYIYRLPLLGGELTCLTEIA